MNYYLHVLRNYANFSGRARRKEYWMFALFNLVFFIAALIVDNVLGTTFSIDTGFGVQELPYGYAYMAYALFVMIPGLAVSVRRMHDVGKSGWFLLIALIPIIGAIWLFVLTLKEGNYEENKWGPNPKLEPSAFA